MSSLNNLSKDVAGGSHVSVFRCFLSGVAINQKGEKKHTQPTHHLSIGMIDEDRHIPLGSVSLNSSCCTWNVKTVVELVDSVTTFTIAVNEVVIGNVDVSKDDILQRYRTCFEPIEFTPIKDQLWPSDYTIELYACLIPISPNNEIVANSHMLSTDFMNAISMDPQHVFLMVFSLNKEITNRTRVLHNCAGHLPECFPTTDNNSLKGCTSAYNDAIDQTEGKLPQFIAFVHQAGLEFINQYNISGDLSMIDEAISKLSIVEKGTPDSDSGKPDCLNDLGRALLIRFEHDEDLPTLRKAMDFIKKAIGMVEEESAAYLNNLGNALCLLFEATGVLSDATEAISHHKRAIELTQEGQIELSMRLNDLGHAQLRYHERTGDLLVIAEAITHLKRAVTLPPASQADLGPVLNNLGNSYRCQFECTGNLDDLSEAISHLQKSVDRCPVGNPNRHTRLSNLGNCFVRRFGRTGDMMDISQAIAYHQQAVNFTSGAGHAEMPLWLNNLSHALKVRFDRAGDMEDIVEAGSHLQNSVQQTPDTHPNLPIYLNNLGSNYRCQFERTGNTAHISEAINYLQRAVDITPDDHLGLPIWLNNLGLSIRCLFDQTNNQSDIDNAIVYMEKSVSLTTSGHTQESTRLTNLGVSYGRRFTLTGDHSDMSQAVSYLQKAHKCTPEDHETLASLLKQLGDTFSERGTRTGNPADIHVAISNYSLAATCSAGPASLRLNAAQRWADLSRTHNQAQLLDAYGVAIDLVSQLAGFEETIQKRYASLLEVSSLSASAAAVAFEKGKPELAIEWLEQGRCLVWSQLNDLRTPLDELQAMHPALAKELLKVSVALDSAGSRNVPLAADNTLLQRMSLQDEITSHVRLAQERDAILKRIRNIPEFAQFLQPPSYSALLEGLPSSGTVIIVNVHADGCNAVALRQRTRDSVHIPLPKFSHPIAEDLRKQMKTCLAGAGIRVRGGIAEQRGMRLRNGNGKGLSYILRELWVLVVYPILNALGYNIRPVHLQRIWWCATGPLSFLPIHAAGIYGTRMPAQERASLPDYAISSYTPTVKTLVDRVKKHVTPKHRMDGLLLICQSDSPGLPRIPGATEEIRVVEKQVRRCSNLKIHCLESVKSTVSDSLEKMNAHNCVHFACHASQNTADPLRSAFYLYDGTLDLSSIIRKRLDGAELAFLSACQTSAGDEKLSEEAVHLAAGMLAAGFQGVVATMWSIQDKYGPRVAESFYSNLVEGDLFKSERAAWSLHSATQKLREALGDKEATLLTWVPYVHFGL